MNRIRFVCDPHVLGLGLELLILPGEDLLLTLTVLCFAIEVTLLRREVSA